MSGCHSLQISNASHRRSPSSREVEYSDAREISEELGTITVKARSVSKPAFELFGKSQRSRSVSVSEQRRPLMLPQEVQAMRSDEAIVFYEGIRPVRCKKIRYFNDRRFKRLIGAPPRYASPALANGETPFFPPRASPVTVSTDVDAQGAAPAAAAKPPRRRRGRRATQKEIAHIEELTLEDFDADLDQVVLPQKADGERLTKDELDAAVESFVAALREH